MITPFHQVWCLALFMMVACLDGHVYSQPIENHFIHYTSRDGLPGGNITQILQDTTGFIWLASQNGLFRFDGQNFKTFTFIPFDTSSLKEGNVCSIFLDSKGRLWAMTHLWVYLYHPDGEWFEHYPIKAFTDDRLEWFCAEEGDQLILSGRKSLYKFDIRQKKYTLFNRPGLKPMRYFDYKKDENGIEWLSTTSGLIRYDPKSRNVITIDSAIWFHKRNDNNVGKIILLPDGNLIAATWRQGIYLVNRKTNKLKQFIRDKNDSENFIHTVYKLNDSTILAPCDSGIISFNFKTESLTTIKPDILNPNSLSVIPKSIFKDREGIIWIGSGFDLEKYDYKDLKIKVIPGLNNPNYSLFKDFENLFRCYDGSFLLGGYHGLGIFDPVSGCLNHCRDKKIGFEVIFDIEEDYRNKFWCLANNDLACFHIYNNNPVDIKQYCVAKDDTEVGEIVFGKNGKILIATIPLGLKIFDTLNEKFTYAKIIDKRPMLPSAIIQDSDGTIWIGGVYGGIDKIEKDGITVKHYGLNKENNPFISEWGPNTIVKDKQGIEWFSTKDFGIGCLNPFNDSLKFFTIEQGLPVSWYWNLVIDDQDNLWAQCKKGVLRFNTNTNQFKLFAENEGFPNPNDISSLSYSKYNKKLYILTSYSIFEVDPDYRPKNFPPPNTYITAFSISDKNKPLFPGKPVLLNHDENFLDIQFTCLLFHSNKQIKFAYKMEGVNKDWVYCNYKRNAPYTNVPPGHYTFLVKSQSPDGVWNSPTSLEIIIMPPFWETWWFILLEIFAGAGLTLWIVRLYTERKLAVQKSEFEKLKAVSTERSRIASDMHDDLGAGLTSIRLLSEVANLKTSEENPAKPEIEKIVNSAGKLSDNLREIIWTMSAKDDKLEDFIIYVRTYSAGFFDGSAIQFHFRRPEVIPELIMHGEVRRNLFLCIKEAMNNIMKHSKANEVSLSFTLSENMLITEITDNGKGFDTSNTNHFGNGIASMKSRLSKFEGKMEIQSNIYGTKVVFSILI